MAYYFKEYGLPFTLWWTSAWIITGFGVYGVVSSGAVGGNDAIGLLKAVGLGSLVDLDSINPSVGNLAVTIAINEALEVVRLPFVIATTPYIARVLPFGKGGSSLGELMRVHGLPFAGLWAGTWLLGAGAVWALLESGLLGGAGAISILKAIPGLDELFHLDGIDPSLGNVGMALVINECLEVVRLPLCVALTPRWSRFLAHVMRR